MSEQGVGGMTPTLAVSMVCHIAQMGPEVQGVSGQILSRKTVYVLWPWADPGEVQGVRTPPFLAHVAGFLILGSKLDPLLGPPFFLLVDLIWTPPPISKIPVPPLLTHIEVLILSYTFLGDIASYNLTCMGSSNAGLRKTRYIAGVVNSHWTKAYSN